MSPKILILSPSKGGDFLAPSVDPTLRRAQDEVEGEFIAKCVMATPIKGLKHRTQI
jgi:hypothetical protein